MIDSIVVNSKFSKIRSSFEVSLVVRLPDQCLVHQRLLSLSLKPLTTSEADTRRLKVAVFRDWHEVAAALLAEAATAVAAVLHSLR